MSVELVYEDELVRLYHGDCVEFMSETDEKFDVIATDPPYGIAYKSNRAKREQRKRLNRRFTGDDDVFDLWLEPCFRCLADGGALYMLTRFDKLCDWLEAIETRGFDIKNVIIWNKLVHTSGDLYGNYGYLYEMIVFATKGRHIPVWEKRDVNVWEIKRIPPSAKRFHPTQKPLEVMERIVTNSVPKNGIVLDPFAGSGTTLIAARKHGRRAVGVEIDKEYIDAALYRLKEESKCI